MATPLLHHRRKLSNAGSNGAGYNNGLSFSNKDAYDDVFSGGLKPKFGAAAAASFSSRRVAAEEYGEIFGGKNGKRGSSIPVLDLADLDEGNGSGDFRTFNGKLDYSMIFGGFDDGGGGADDVAMPVPVPAYEELFTGVKRAKSNKAKARIPAGTGSALKGSDYFNSSDNIKSHSCEASDQIFDGGKQFNMSYHKTGERKKDGLNGTTHIAELHAIPGFTYVIDESARLQKTQQDKAMPPVQVEIDHNRSSSDSLKKTELGKAMSPVKVEVNSKSSGDDISERKSGARAKWQFLSSNASEGLVKQKGECNGDAAFSRDKLLNTGEVDRKPHLSKEPSHSSSSANLKDSKGHPKRSNFSSFDPKVEASGSANGYASPFSDEELDLNSDAAAPAAALKKAMEQAQESIRIAKEIMERKRDSVQSSKSRFKDSLKAIGRGEIDYAPEANNTRENNVKETLKSMENEAQNSIEFDQEIGLGNGEVVSAFTEKEKSVTGRQSVAETNCGNVETTENNGVAMWFTQLLNNGKHRMAALASELVGKKDNILQPMDKDLDNVEETKPAKVTSEWGTTGKVDGVDRILQCGNTDSKLNALGRSEELEKNVDNASSQCVNENKISETLIFAQNDEVTKIRQHSLDEEEKCEVNLEFCHETLNDRQFELHNLGKVLQENELLRPEKISFEQEEGTKLEDFSAADENDGRVDEVEIKKLEELHLWVDNEDVACVNEVEPKPTTDYVSNGERREDHLEKWLEGYHKQESEEERLTESVEGEESHSLLEEDDWEGTDTRPAGPQENEEAGSIGEHGDNSSVDQEIEVNGELQESAENPRANLFQEAIYKESLDAAFDADNTYQSVNLVDIQDTCRSEVENTGEKTNQLESSTNYEDRRDLAGSTEQSNQQESRNNEEVAHTVGISEYLNEFDGDAKPQQAVGEASSLKGEQILETSCVDHTAQEHIMESKIQDISDASASADKTATFCFTNMVHESEQSKDSDMDGFIDNDIKQYAVENEYAAEASEVNNPSNFDSSDLNEQTQIHENDRKFEFSLNSQHYDGSVHEVYGQKQVEESDRESESSMDPDCGDGFFHESGGTVENMMVEGISCEEEIEKDNIERYQKEREWIENEKESESSHSAQEEDMETNTDAKTGQSSENYGENVCKTSVKEEKEIRDSEQKEEAEKDSIRRAEVNKRNREREKDRIAVERAIREARERAFAEARERAERAAVEKATAEFRQRAMAEARDKLDKVSSGTKVPTDKASIAAKLKAERAAVERATAEARERALEKALSQKSTTEMKTQAERNVAGKFSSGSRDAGIKHSYSSSDLENYGSNSESEQRRKARLERHQRIMERAAKALAEKNLRDVLAQREQAQKNRLAETLDADIKRWASGKEGNLRALLSTLQYILGPSSGWQPISLTEIITSAAVKKAYRKATLYVHPDKLQQRGASIQQKYICEKVFDLLKAAWNKFNSEER